MPLVQGREGVNMNSAVVLECQNIFHGFHEKNVLHDVNLGVIRGQTVALVGPSGCGKSTLLRAIVGTHPPRQGKVIVFSGCEKNFFTVVTSPGRDRGIVYQRYTLFPFWTAQENVAAGLMLDNTSIPFRLLCPLKWRKIRKKHLDEAGELLHELGLGDAIRAYPCELSGGMCQRVAIAQSLIMKPQVILLDEPFGALDEATREDLQRMLLTLYHENVKKLKREERPSSTILIVTHELNEAIFVADRILGLSQYWNWKERGFSFCPGATIVYDRTVPVYEPDDVKNLADFSEQRDEIRNAVFNPDIPTDPRKYVTFWDEVKNGKGEGVLAHVKT